MRYDKDGLPVKEYYTEELKTPTAKKMKALEYQKYYTGGSIILMIYIPSINLIHQVLTYHGKNFLKVLIFL